MCVAMTLQRFESVACGRTEGQGNGRGTDGGIRD